ncbi:MAR-binding filament-like protein 1-1 [Actinidia eriantha]|uniref:MAR-binding filament-like protein 1-1 n=1 Tax=Actinidia eriantha TaxID=165200 RepID=UPI00258AEA13|nr:MAR-binding filament-like protein 1-1 [Actinidia eriantha]
MGTSCFFHSILYQSLSPPSSSSLHPSQSVISNAFPRNGGHSRKNRTAKACLNGHKPNDSVFSKRRSILLLGISVLPFLQLNAKAFEEWPTEEPEIKTAEQKQTAEQTLQGDASPNPSFPLLNGLGVFGSGVLGVLYALARKEEIASEAMIDSMTKKLNEKEDTVVSLKKSFELKLLSEKDERTKQRNKANEEHLSLMNQLKLANSTITRLGQELQSEKRSVADLKAQIENLQTDLSRAAEDRKELEEKMKEKLNSIEFLQEKITLLGSEIKDKEDNLCNLKSLLAAKESELKKLNSAFEQTKDELDGAHSEIKRLKQELLKNEKELELKNGVVNDLNAQVTSLTAERDGSYGKLDLFQREYDDLNSSSEEKAAADAKLLKERDKELHGLKEKIDLTLNEVSRNEVLVVDLTQEIDNLRKMLDAELSNVKNLKHELQIAQETLGKSRNEVSELAKQLQQSRSLCSDLEAEICRVQAEFSEARDSFQNSRDEAKNSAEVLAGELMSAIELLKKTKDKLQSVSRDLAAAVENRDILKKELVDVYKRAESASHDLKEEKKVVTSLNKELQALEKQVSKDRELRKSLETDLEEATKSLDEMNRNAMVLSRDLEMAKSEISGLENEKDMIYKSLGKQKQVSQESRESLEDAHNLVMRLGKERESLKKREKKLEEELALAKGKILRLRSQTNSSKALVNDQHQLNVDTGENNAVPVKKNTRRKVNTQQDKS